MKNLLINKAQVMPVPQAIAYGFVIPVGIEKSLWQQYRLCEFVKNSQSLDCLLASYAAALKKQATRTDIVFDCRMWQGAHSAPKHSTIKLRSSLEFDQHRKPYLIVKHH